MAKSRGKPSVPPDTIKRTVDLGREEELVTWDEWFNRSMSVMRKAVPKQHHERLSFRVSLADGREFAVKQVVTHVARGKCTIGPSRWNAREAICDVITGYLLLGVGPEYFPTAVCLPPTMITAVECVLTPGDEEIDGTPVPFGFYKREGINAPTEKREVEETLAQGAI